MTEKQIVWRETILRILGGCAVAILIAGSGIAHQIWQQKPRPKPTDEEIIISCQPCYEHYPSWWCEWVWGCPPKPPSGGATIKK